MKVLLDTNILVDFLAKRPVFFNNAQTIIKKCKDNEITGIVAVHTISTFIFSRSNSAAEKHGEFAYGKRRLLTYARSAHQCDSLQKLMFLKTVAF